MVARVWNLGRDRRHADLSTVPLLRESDVETLVELPLPPGNVAVSPEGRLFFDLHPSARPRRFSDATVFELVDGQPRPYPSQAFQPRYRGPLGMTVDRQDRLWLVEPQGVERYPTRLLGFDLATDQLVYELELDPRQTRVAQDLRISPDGSTAYLADTGILTFVTPRLLVLDIERRHLRTVLRCHPSVRPQRIVMHPHGRPFRIGFGALPFRVGVDGIALSHDGQWLYYAAMSHDTLYRVPTAVLHDPGLIEAEVARHVERVGAKPVNDGIDIDPVGYVYLTDVEHGGIARISPSGVVTTVTSSPSVRWPDGVAVGSDGSVTFTDSAIPHYFGQLGRPPTKAVLDAGAPYRIHRFSPPAIGGSGPAGGGTSGSSDSCRS